MQIHAGTPGLGCQTRDPSSLCGLGCISLAVGGAKPLFPRLVPPPPRGYKLSGAQRARLEPPGTGRAGSSEKAAGTGSTGSAGSTGSTRQYRQQQAAQAAAPCPQPARPGSPRPAEEGWRRAEGAGGGRLFWGSSLAFFFF